MRMRIFGVFKERMLGAVWQEKGTRGKFSTYTLMAMY